MLAATVRFVATRCAKSFYDGLGGKHRSREVFAVVIGARGPALSYPVVSGESCKPGEISIDDLTLLARDPRYKVTLHRYDMETPIPPATDDYKGRGARALFDPAKAREALKGDYPTWVRHCARMLPESPTDSLEYSLRVAEEFVKLVPVEGLRHALTAAPGVLVYPAEDFVERFWGNFGVADVAADFLCGRLTPNATRGQIETFLGYAAYSTPETNTRLLLRALERLGVWDPRKEIAVPQPADGEAPYGVYADEDGDLVVRMPPDHPPCPELDAIRARLYLLGFELGIDDLPGRFGVACNEDGESPITLYDLRDASASRSAEFAAAQAQADRRVQAVTETLVKRHGLVRHQCEAVLRREGFTSPRAGLPVVLDGVAMLNYALVGLTEDGRVFFYKDNDEFALEFADDGTPHLPGPDDEDVALDAFADDNTDGVFWYPSQDDAVRGTRVRAEGYEERLQGDKEALEESIGTPLEPIHRALYEETFFSGGEYEGDREIRARLLASLDPLPDLENVL